MYNHKPLIAKQIKKHLSSQQVKEKPVSLDVTKNLDTIIDYHIRTQIRAR